LKTNKVKSHLLNRRGRRDKRDVARRNAEQQR